MKKPETESKRISFNLTENALDFLLAAAECVRRGDHRSLKYSLLHLVASIELAIKARLFLEDWRLVFQDPNEATEAAFTKGDFKSVYLDAAIDRLEDITFQDIDKKVLDDLISLRNLRNQVQHFAINVEREQMIALLAKGYNFVVGFCTQELSSEIEQYKDSFNNIIENLREFEGFVAERRESIKPDLEEAIELYDCPRCLEYTLKIGHPPPKCAFCGYVVSAEELADRITEGGRGMCPNCDHDACVVVIYNNDEAGWFCTACGERETEYGRCLRCSRLTYPDEELCSACLEEIMSKD